MKKAIASIMLCTLVSFSPPALANDGAKKDQADVTAAFDAIRNKNPEKAVKKANKVIQRFEADKQSDAIYQCTSGTSDTLIALMGAAATADRGETEEGKTKTVAVSNNICLSYFAKGFALIDLRRKDEALPNLEMAVEMDTDNQQFLNELAEWYKADKNWPKSLEVFTVASETTDLAVSMMDNKKQSKQILDRMRCRSFRGIAFNHAEMKNWKEARAAVDKCLALVPDDAGSLRELQYINTHSKKE